MWPEHLWKLVCHGKSKPLGKVLHYFIKAESQACTSEDAHTFFWCDLALPEPDETENDEGELCLGDNKSLAQKVEKYVSSILPEVTTEDKDRVDGPPGTH